MNVVVYANFEIGVIVKFHDACSIQPLLVYHRARYEYNGMTMHGYLTSIDHSAWWSMTFSHSRYITYPKEFAAKDKARFYNGRLVTNDEEVP